MISLRSVKKVCCGDYTLIEGYSDAVSDNTQVWHLHHKDEELGFTRDDLIQSGSYYGVPPEKLAFVTFADHNRIHNRINIDKIKERMSGDKSPAKRQEVRKKMSEAAKTSEKHKKWIEILNLSKRVPLYQYSLDGIFIRKWSSYAELKRTTGFNRGTIAKVCEGTYKQAYGYFWTLQPLCLGSDTPALFVADLHL